MANFDASKWAVITPITAEKECDITTMKAGIFSFDLDAFETACATATGCTFDKTAYVPYAFGFLWQEGTTKCSEDGPYIMVKPGSFWPFEGFYWNHGLDNEYVTLYNGVTYYDFTDTFYFSDKTYCNDFQFLEGCFADLRGSNTYHLTFSLLKSTTGLGDGSSHSFFFLWDKR